MILVVLTSPRPNGADYLPAILSALELQRWGGERWIWSDGGTVAARPGWRVFARPRRGPPNTFAFWELLAALPPGVPITIFEDDVQPSPGTLPYIERMGCRGQLAYVSWFDGICRRSEMLPRLRYIDASEVITAQARTYSPGTIATLLAAREAITWHPGVQYDACMAPFLSGQLAAVHVPSLVQHVGARSALGNAPLDGMRRSESWLGETFDVDHAFHHVDPQTLFRP